MVLRRKARWSVAILAMCATGCGLLPEKNVDPAFLAQYSNGAPVAPSATVKVLDVTLNQKSLQLLQTNCASCHNGGPGTGRLTDVAHLDAIFNAGLIVPGDATNSILMQRISSGSMPPAGMSAADKLTIHDWIQTGMTKVSATP